MAEARFGDFKDELLQSLNFSQLSNAIFVTRPQGIKNAMINRIQNLLQKPDVNTPFSQIQKLVQTLMKDSTVQKRYGGQLVGQLCRSVFNNED